VAAAAANADSFESLVRAVTHEYLKYYDERGMLLQRLQSEPSVSNVHDATEYGRDAAVDYLAEIVITRFDLPRDIARAATDISLGLPASAGAFLRRSDMDRQMVEDITVTMVVGAIQTLTAQYVGDPIADDK
jgi:TetR/AcrR family transcriptional regulator, fatty acid biosynthesis regulator